MEAAASFLYMLISYILWLLNMQGLVGIGLTASELQRTLLKSGIFRLINRGHFGIVLNKSETTASIRMKVTFEFVPIWFTSNHVKKLGRGLHSASLQPLSC